MRGHGVRERERERKKERKREIDRKRVRKGRIRRLEGREEESHLIWSHALLELALCQNPCPFYVG